MKVTEYRRRVSSGSPFVRLSVNVGTIAELAAPSPKIARNALGTVHAVTKALEMSPEPTYRAHSTSRTSPSRY